MSVMLEYALGWIIAVVLMAIFLWAAPHLIDFFDIGLGTMLIVIAIGVSIACVYCAWRLLVSLCETFCSHD